MPACPAGRPPRRACWWPCPGAWRPTSASPTTSPLYMLLGALALWLCARGLRGDRRSFALGGVVVGLAFLSRNDGILLGVPYALAFRRDLLRPPRLTRIGWLPALVCAVGFLVVVTPWLVRQVEVFGSISPSSIGGRILFIREYRELYSVSSETTLASFLAQGPQALIGSRIDGLVGALACSGPNAVADPPRAAAPDRRVAAAARPRLSPLVGLRRGAPRLQRHRLRRPCSPRHVPALGRRPRPARLPPVAGRPRGTGGVGRGSSAGVGDRDRDAEPDAAWWSAWRWRCRPPRR